MAKKWKRLPDHLKPLLPTVRELSAKGLNKTQICRQCSFTVNGFSSYKELHDEYENGRSDLALKVGKSFVDALPHSYSDRVHLSKALRLFDGSYHLDEISSVESALEALNVSLVEFAKGNISIDSLEQIRKTVATYSDVVISTEIEQRLKAVEKQLKARK